MKIFYLLFPVINTYIYKVKKSVVLPPYSINIYELKKNQTP